jgi:hypothetical protein
MCVREREDLKESDPLSQPANAASRPTDQLLLYYGTTRVSVRGPVTGTLYLFSRQQPIQTVDPRDAVSMLKTRLFRRIR